MEEARAAFESRPEVLYAEPNYTRRAAAAPNDPSFGQLWGLHNTGQAVSGPSGTVTGTPDADIDAPEAWDFETGDPAVVVAVVDSGVEYRHPDLAPNIWANPDETINGLDDDGNGLVDDVRGWDFADSDNDPRDFEGHGTHVAGTIGAVGNNGLGVTGVAWNVKIMPLRVSPFFTTAELVDAFAYAALEGARVLNGSFGGPQLSQAVADVIALSENVLFVFAADNGGDDGVGDNSDLVADYPCRLGAELDLPNVICVAATDQGDNLAPFSNFGANSVDLGAPGTNVLSTFLAISLVFGDDFEAGLGNWTTGGTNNTWGLTTAASVSPPNSLTDSPAGDYANGTDSFVRTTNPLNLVGKTDCAVIFELRLDTELDSDFILAEAAPAAEGPWTILGGESGSTGGEFVPAGADLSTFDGQPTVFLRFRLVSDASIADDGVYIDDVLIGCLATPTGDTVEYDEGTSMAAPHVSGAAALVIAQFPGATPGYVRDALLSSVEQKPSLVGKTLSGGRLNAFLALDTASPTNQRIASEPLFQKDNVFSIGWGASDLESGVGSYDVRYRRARFNGGFGSPVAFRNRTPAANTGDPFPGATGYTYCFSVRARDRVGNISGFSTERCTAVPVNNTQLAHSAGWAKRTGSGYFENTYSLTTTRGATLSLSVAGRRFAVVVTRCPGCGTIQVLLGAAVLRTIDLNATSTARRQIIPVKNFTSARTGTLRIRVVSPTGERVIVEGVGVSRI